MYKAVFLDLDGTLLDDNKKISEENKEAIKQAKEKGVQVFLCSGRQQNLVKDYKNEINASDYIICCNGAEIYDCNSKQELFSSNLPEDVVYNLYEYANSRKYLTRIDTRYGRFINDMKYFISKEVEIEPDLNKFISENKVLQFTIGTETEEEIDSVIEYIKSLNRSDIKIENKYLARAKTYTVWAINIINVNTSKGNAINGLCKYLKIDVNNVIGMGDDHNDISMMKTVGYGVAMGNAVPKLKEYAKEVTLTNNESGVAKILKNKI
jgi:Cof subfamily protein (haloacid dehalogenase superfamily)